VLIDHLINNIAIKHKNPRVRQMVVDRVEQLINKFFLSDDQSSTVNE
jgi:DNA polymerase sigma